MPEPAALSAAHPKKNSLLSTSSVRRRSGGQSHLIGSPVGGRPRTLLRRCKLLQEKELGEISSIWRARLDRSTCAGWAVFFLDSDFAVGTIERLRYGQVPPRPLHAGKRRRPSTPAVRLTPRASHSEPDAVLSPPKWDRRAKQHTSATTPIRPCLTRTERTARRMRNFNYSCRSAPVLRQLGSA